MVLHGGQDVVLDPGEPQVYPVSSQSVVQFLEDVERRGVEFDIGLHVQDHDLGVGFKGAGHLVVEVVSVHEEQRGVVAEGHHARDGCGGVVVVDVVHSCVVGDETENAVVGSRETGHELGDRQGDGDDHTRQDPEEHHGDRAGRGNGELGDPESQKRGPLGGSHQGQCCVDDHTGQSRDRHLRDHAGYQ